MRRIYQRKLSHRAKRMLAERRKKVLDAPDRAAEAARLWQQKSGKSWDEIRATLAAMATGVERCMYCEDSEGTDIEHFYPKSRYPEDAYEWDNYLLACSRCNSNYKRDHFPVNDEGWPLLIKPTHEDPADYIEYSPTTGMWIDIDSYGVGAQSRRVFGLDRATLVRGRRAAWQSYQAYVIRYDRLRQQGRDTEAQRYLEGLVDLPFSSLMTTIVRFAADPQRRGALAPELVAALARRPEIAASFAAPDP